jgi:hypothetical protein
MAILQTIDGKVLLALKTLNLQSHAANMGWPCTFAGGKGSVEGKVFCLMTLPSTKIHFKTLIYLNIQ